MSVDFEEVEIDPDVTVEVSPSDSDNSRPRIRVTASKIRPKGRKSSNTSRSKRKATNKSTKKKVAGSTNRKPSGAKKSQSDQRRRSTAHPPVAQQRRNSTQQNRGKTQTQQQPQAQKPQGHDGGSDDKTKVLLSSKTPSRKRLLWADDDDDGGSDGSVDEFPIPLSTYTGTHIPFDYCKRDLEYGCFGDVVSWCGRACACSKPSRSTCWGACGILCCTIGSLVTLFGFIVSWALCTTHPTLLTGVALIVSGSLVALIAMVVYPRVRTTRQQQQRIGDIDDMRARGFNNCIDGATTPVPDRAPSGIIPSAPPIPLSYSLDLSIQGGGCAASWPMRGRRHHSEPYDIVLNERNTFPRISNHVSSYAPSVVNLWEPTEDVALMDENSGEVNAELSVIYENEINA